MSFIIISKVRRQEAVITLIKVKLQISKAYMERTRGMQWIFIGWFIKGEVQ
jgi:hypothetical protein